MSTKFMLWIIFGCQQICALDDIWVPECGRLGEMIGRDIPEDLVRGVSRNLFFQKHLQSLIPKTGWPSSFTEISLESPSSLSTPNSPLESFA